MKLPGTRVDFSNEGNEMDGPEYLQGLGYIQCWMG